MNKYNIDDYIMFKEYPYTMEGIIVGISDSNNPTYCIIPKINEHLENAHTITESDLNYFLFKSKIMEDNLGKKAFWKSELSIIGYVRIGCKCIRCKEYNKYVPFKDEYKCWSCTNYPYR